MSDNAPPRDELDLATLAATVLRGWKIILACLVAALGFAYAWTEHTPKMYAAHMVVMPSRPVEGPNGGRGAAAAAAVQFNLYLQSLTSHGLAERLAKNGAAMAALDPHGEGWSPSGAQLHRFLAQRLIVEHDAKAAWTASVTLTTGNPDGGVKFLAALDKAANDYVQAQTGAPDPKAAPPAPAARLFDGPYAVDEPVSPHLRPTLRNAAIGGLLAGVALVLLLHVFFGSARKTEQNAAP